MTVRTAALAPTRFLSPALHRLRVAAAHCVALAGRIPAPDLDVEVERRLHTLFVRILECEGAGVAAAEIAEAAAPVRRLVAASPLFARLQAVAPGAGPDHRTRELLDAERAPSPPGTLGHLLDGFLLASPIAAQLRNRAVWREALLLETLLARGGGAARVLVLGAGPALEVRRVARRVRFAPGQVTVHDADPAAIAHVLAALGPRATGMRFVTGDVRRTAADLAAACRFDLVLVGDALDATDDGAAAALLRIVHDGLLAPDGRIALAAASAGDPLRPCLDHLTSWRPVRRTPAGVAALLAQAGVQGGAMVTRDGTGLAIMAEATRRQVARHAA